VLDRRRPPCRRAVDAFSRRAPRHAAHQHGRSVGAAGGRRVTALCDPRLRALILAPRGRDAVVAATLFGRAGVPVQVCLDLPGVVGALDESTAFVLMTEEAIRTADLNALSQWLAQQPAWSDLPFVVVTDHGGGPERNPIAARWLEALGNVS